MGRGGKSARLIGLQRSANECQSHQLKCEPWGKLAGPWRLKELEMLCRVETDQVVIIGATCSWGIDCIDHACHPFILWMDPSLKKIS